jgi:hypothetical protein
LAKRTAIVGLVGALLSIPLSGLAIGQTEGEGHITVRHEAMPIEHLWFTYLRTVVREEEFANRREREGRDASQMRNSCQRSFRFTDEDCESIRTAAHRLDAEIKELDAKAKALIDADRAAHPRTPEMTAMSQQWSEKHTQILEREVSELYKALGPEASADMDAYVESRYGQIHAHPQRQPEGSFEPRPLTRLQMYERFLGEVDYSRIRRQSDDGPGAEFHTFYKRELGFSDEQFQQVRSTAQRLQSELQESFARQVHARAEMRHVPPELGALEQQRQSAIATEVSHLQQVLGPENTAVVERYLRTGVRSGSTIIEYHPSGEATDGANPDVPAK